MLPRNISFSIQPKNKDAIKLVEWFKLYSIRTGVKFSHIVITALREYKEKLEATNGK